MLCAGPKLPGDSVGKDPTCKSRRYMWCRCNPWVEKIPWRRAWQPILIFLPRVSPWTEAPGGLQSMGSQSQTRLKWLSTQDIAIALEEVLVQREGGHVDNYRYKSNVFFFLIICLFIVLFIFGCAGSSFFFKIIYLLYCLLLAVLGRHCCVGFFSCDKRGLLSSCGAWASHGGGAQALGHVGFSSCGSQALEHRLSSCGAWA